VLVVPVVKASASTGASVVFMPSTGPMSPDEFRPHLHAAEHGPAACLLRPAASACARVANGSVDFADVNVADLPLRHPASWTRATRHPFLAAVRDGSLPASQFDVWLAQDYRFVGDLLRLQARLVGQAPRSAQAVLAAGIVALVDELTWFERQAAARHIDLRVAALPATVAYGRLLERLDREDFAVALAMLWTLERTYLDAWSFAAPGAGAYRDFVAPWTTPEFRSYVDALEAATNQALGDGADLDPCFGEVIEAEALFWDMAVEAP
jgi:formylaminopyrimidine deformylase / aminopyrimidine aminohydrolase